MFFGQGELAELAAGLVEGYPLVDEIRAREPDRVPAVVEAVAQAIRPSFGDAPVKGRITALVALAIA